MFLLLLHSLLFSRLFGYVPHHYPLERWNRHGVLQVAYPSFQEGAGGSKSSTDGVASLRQTSTRFVNEALETIRKAQYQIQDNLDTGNIAKAVQQATSLVERIAIAVLPKLASIEQRQQVCGAIDSLLHKATDTLFSSTPLTKADILRGISLLQLHEALAAPYCSVPRQTLLHTIHVIASLLEKRKNQYDPELTNTAYRILQRLVVGHGVRNTSAELPFLSEAIFSKVMRSFCSGGRMEMAHRVAALQERTQHAPPLSAVSYSILIKGAGQWQGRKQVDALVRRIQTTQIVMDAVLWNTIMDAYVNCHALDQAQAVFRDMQESSSAAGPKPNNRSYNTLLKGLAGQSTLREATAWAASMQREGFWDAVSTNTLVHAAIRANEFAVAEEILEQHTMPPKRRRRQHPNVEAYSELLDCYGKENRLPDALRVLKTMRLRDVPPNDVTCACLLRWLGVYGKFDLANTFTKEYGPVSSKVYHAYIAGVVAYDQPETLLQDTGVAFDVRVRTALSILREMTTLDAKPTAPTIGIIVDTLSKCNPPRTDEARSFFNMLQQRGTIASDCVIVNTAFIKAYGNERNITASLESFKRITQPDTIAVNAFLHACKKCNQDSVLVRTFRHHFDVMKLRPDVVSYSTILSSLLKRYSVNAFRTARSLYTDMKRRKVKLDKALVDTILKSFLRPETVQQLRKVDIEFLAEVWHDAGSLDWEEEQALRRQRSLRSVLAYRVQATFGSFGQLDALFPSNSGSLLEKKGWNPVESGFQLWGNATITTEATPVDSFLLSKGWNDVDSSFRLF